MIRIVSADSSHVAAICANARPLDEQEIHAASGLPLCDAMHLGMHWSAYCFTAFYNDEPLCMFGLSTAGLMTGEGCPWAIGTTFIEKHRRAFMKESRRQLEKAVAICPHLVNFVDDRNAPAKAWLKWLGFTIAEPEPYGVGGLMFRRFEIGEVK